MLPLRRRRLLCSCCIPIELALVSWQPQRAGWEPQHRSRRPHACIDAPARLPRAPPLHIDTHTQALQLLAQAAGPGEGAAAVLHLAGEAADGQARQPRQRRLRWTSHKAIA